MVLLQVILTSSRLVHGFVDVASLSYGTVFPTGLGLANYGQQLFLRTLTAPPPLPTQGRTNLALTEAWCWRFRRTLDRAGVFIWQNMPQLYCSPRPLNMSILGQTFDLENFYL